MVSSTNLGLGRGMVSEQTEDIVYSYSFISGQSVTVLSSALKLHDIVVGRAQSGALISVLGGVSNNATIINYIQFDAVGGAPRDLDYDIRLNNGMTLVVSGTVNLVVTYK